MARAGTIIENPITGERVMFRQTAADTEGELLQFDLFLMPNGEQIVEHIHPHQEERFTVRSGTLQMCVNGVERSVGTGETVCVPAGEPHIWWNGSPAEVQVAVEFRPALHTEEFFEILFGLSRDGKTDSQGHLSLLQAATVAPFYDMYLARPPILMQRLLFAVLAPIAELRGHRARYPEYIDGAPLSPLIEANR